MAKTLWIVFTAHRLDWTELRELELLRELCDVPKLAHGEELERNRPAPSMPLEDGEEIVQKIERVSLTGVVTDVACSRVARVHRSHRRE